MDPTGLPLWSQPLPDEPAHGLAMRLAAVNGLPNIYLVWSHTGLAMAKLQRGEQLDALAAAVRCGVEEIARNSFKLDPDGLTVRVRGVPLNFQMDFGNKRRRVCPACLRESPHHRFFWDITFLTSCPRHGLALETHCNCAKASPLSWHDSRLWRGRCCRRTPRESAGDLRKLAGTPGSAEVIAMDAYFAGRLGVLPPRLVPAFDRIDMHSLLELLERIGSLHHAGWSKTWKGARDLPDLTLADVRATGFLLIADGGFDKTLDNVYRGYVPEAPGILPSLTTAYGWFYRYLWTRGGPKFSPEIADAMFRHAASRFRFGRQALRESDVVFSEETKRLRKEFNDKFMTQTEAALECGGMKMSQKIRRIAVDYNLMADSKPLGRRRAALKRTDVAVIKDFLPRLIDKQGIGEILGTGVYFTQRLDADGLLTPIIAKRADRVRLGRGAYLVDDLTDILEAFETNMDGEIDRLTPAEVPVVAGGAARPRLGLLIEAVKAGKLRPIGLRGSTAIGLRRYCFRVSDIVALGSLPPIAPQRPIDLDFWRRRLVEVRQRHGGVLPAPPQNAGHGWPRQTSDKAKRPEVGG